MDLLWGFLAPQNLFNSLFWALLTGSIVRAMLKWLIRQGLDSKREIAFWMLVPFLFFLFISALRGMNAPLLELRIHQLSIRAPEELSPPFEGKGSVVMVFASVKNSGGPTIADSWDLTVEALKSPVTGKRHSISVPMAFAMEGGKFAEWGPQDALYQKTVVAPVASGAMVSGLLLFSFEEISKDTMTNPDTVFTLSCVDVRGRSYAVHTDLKLLGRKGLGEVPGMNFRLLDSVPPPVDK